MYRIGHGDCFLLAFDGKEKPIHVLIDCGYKPGSPRFINTDPTAVVDDIKRVTGGMIDVAIITHEHQDHLNAITRARFEGLAIRQLWLGWTESANDPLAKRLRKKHGDTLRALTLAQKRLATSHTAMARNLANHLALEIGGELEALGAGFGAAGGWTNKDALRLLRDRSEAEVRLFYPHQEVSVLPGTSDVRVIALGPPYDETLIGDLNPHGDESFPTGGHSGSPASFATALEAALGGAGADQPFSPRRSIPIKALRQERQLRDWYERRYGSKKTVGDVAGDEIADNAPFRRIESDWLQASEHLALAMGNDTNNSSLVLAFELGRGGKVLLFAGDAQRGNWASWADKTIPDGEAPPVEVRELLGRTVLYKVGHHGSHNATLDGRPSSQTPNLAWLGRGRYADEFTAMITAVREWATQDSVGWDHPLPSIKMALSQKCAGRVFQTDTDFANMRPHGGGSELGWKRFQARASGSELYFDYLIEPE